MPATAPRRRLATITGALLLAGLAAGVGGCYYPGGPMWSADRFTYESTTWEPWTVSIEDTRTGQTFWTMDVPVGQQLVIDFNAADAGKSGMTDEGSHGQFTPDTMRWELMPAGRRYGGLDNTLAVPPANSRLVRATLRHSPELPEEMIAAQGGPAPVRTIGTPPPPPSTTTRPATPAEEPLPEPEPQPE